MAACVEIDHSQCQLMDADLTVVLDKLWKKLVENNDLQHIPETCIVEKRKQVLVYLVQKLDHILAIQSQLDDTDAHSVAEQEPEASAEDIVELHISEEEQCRESSGNNDSLQEQIGTVSQEGMAETDTESQNLEIDTAAEMHTVGNEKNDPPPAGEVVAPHSNGHDLPQQLIEHAYIQFDTSGNGSQTAIEYVSENQPYVYLEDMQVAVGNEVSLSTFINEENTRGIEATTQENGKQEFKLQEVKLEPVNDPGIAPNKTNDPCSIVVKTENTVDKFLMKFSNWKSKQNDKNKKEVPIYSEEQNLELPTQEDVVEIEIAPVKYVSFAPNTEVKVVSEDNKQIDFDKLQEDVISKIITHSTEVCDTSEVTDEQDYKDMNSSSISMKTGDRWLYYCKKCNKKFASMHTLKIHERLHYNPSKCKTCGKCFAQASQLRAHEVLHTGHRPFKCEICKKTFTFSSSLKFHMRMHNNEKPFTCTECGLSFSQSGNLTAHMMTHFGDRPFKCSECPKAFRNEAALQRHLSSHKEVDLEKGEGFQCDICGKIFRSKSYKRAHMLSHDDSPVDCPQCQKQLKNQAKLEEHIRFVHEGKAKCMCDICGKVFSSKGSLTQHRRFHSKEYALAKAKIAALNRGAIEVQPSKFDCEVCGRVLKTKRNYKDHMKIHNEEKQHKCQECGLMFRQKGTLKRHMKVHTGEKQFACSECGKLFREIANVKDHQIAIHLKQKPHKCRLCGVGFALATTLKNHMLTHTDERNWACSMCQKKFKCEKHLRLHEVIHSDNREEYFCDWCGGRFKRAVCLTKHQKKCNPRYELQM